MFPLGSVLLPHMPLPLRVFEPRYLQLLAEVLPSEPAEFGVTLIERGVEVGGGDARFALGTVAQVAEVGSDEGSVILLARGARRIRVERWLGDDPYPRAEVAELPELGWEDHHRERLDRVDAEVRRAIARATEFAELPWPPDIDLDEDPVTRAWQLGGIAPVGPLDQLAFLGAGSIGSLLEEISARTAEAVDTFVFRAGDDGIPPGDD